MVSASQYQRAKQALLDDPALCPQNRTLLIDFFGYEEYKLTRQNGLPALDVGCRRTLYCYVVRIRNVLRWFNQKPWIHLTREDIKRVYDALEDGRIRTRGGAPFQDRVSYYNKIFKSKPFRLAGKDRLASEVIEYSIPQVPPVRFLTEATFRKLADAASGPRLRALLWLAWDVGENIGTLLLLQARDFTLQTNPHSGEDEYLVRLERPKLKRSRLARSEPTLYPETVEHLRPLIAAAPPDGLLFAFGHRYAAKCLAEAVARCHATTEPLGAHVRWKDLRSGMACHLLRSGWTRDEVNARLGHTPRSSALDAYINFMALDRAAPKLRMRSRTTSPPGASTVVPVSPATPTVHGAQLPSPNDPHAAAALGALRDSLIAKLHDVTRVLASIEGLPSAAG
ncbi:MAG: hypothetical protein WAZ94_08405 [Phycisphaerales bacterium]